MNLYETIYKNIPVTVVYNNKHTSFSKKLAISRCYICSAFTTIPYFVCTTCVKEHLGFQIGYTKAKGYHILNKKPRKGGEIWNEKQIPNEVTTYNGERIDKKTIDDRYGDTKDTFATYAIRLSCKRDIYIDSCSIRCFVSLMNSSETPNCEFIKVNDEVRLRFLKDIDIDEELFVFYDYDKNSVDKTYQPTIITL